MSIWSSMALEHRAEIALALGALTLLLFLRDLERRPAVTAAVALGFTGLAVAVGYDFSRSVNVSVPLVTGVLAVSLLLMRTSPLAQRVLLPDAVALLLIGGTGAIAVASGGTLLEISVGLATVSLVSSTLIGLGTGDRALEAAFKYFVQSAVTFAIALFGVALVFVATGSLGLPELAALAPEAKPLVLVGLTLFLAGLGLKLALAPFHLGPLDAYTAGPAAVVGYVMTLSKVAAVIALARIAAKAGGAFGDVLLVVGLLSIVWGVLASFQQRDLRRLLAYSAVAHAGFLALAAADGSNGARVGVFYVACYAASALLIYAALAGSGTHALPAGSRYLTRLGPLRAGALILGLASLAGIPPTPGFWAKLAVLVSTWERFGGLALSVAALGGVLGAIYYLRPIPSLLSAFERGRPSRLGQSGAVILAAGVVIAIGFGPAVLWWLARGVAAF